MEAASSSSSSMDLRESMATGCELEVSSPTPKLSRSWDNHARTAFSGTTPDSGELVANGEATSDDVRDVQNRQGTDKGSDKGPDV